MILFNTKGYQATSIAEIAKATGTTKGAIYGNFENKDALAIAAFDKANNTIQNQLTNAISQQKTAPLKLKSIIGHYEKYIKNPPIAGGSPIINTAIEADDTHPVLRERVHKTMTLIKNLLEKIVIRGIRENQIRAGVDARLYANMFYATLKGAILIARVEGNNQSFQIVKGGLEQQIDAISI